MKWRSMRGLYEPEETIDSVWDEVDRRYVVPMAYANTELFSKCNIALRTSGGHIIVDDCSESKLNGRTFRNEREWRKEVGLDEDMEMIDELFGG